MNNRSMQKSKWNYEHYDRVSVVFKKGMKDEMKLHAAERGETLNAFINRAVDETMNRDGTAKVKTDAISETPEE